MKHPDSSFARSEHFKLGLFGANCLGGIAVTNVPERWDPSWKNNVDLALLADKVGLDFLLPIARWRGLGGDTGHASESLEPIAWASGLLAKTERINVFATVHAPLIHPVFAAKQLATVDQMAGGRLGLNVVLGWRPDEFGMFGVDLHAQSSDRYEYGREWLEIVRKVWRAVEPFDYEGQFFELTNVSGTPSPFEGDELLIMNAGSSDAGREFAAAQVDCWFGSAASREDSATREMVTDFRQLARGQQRDVDAYTVAFVVCRSSREEAESYLHHYAIANQDTESLKALLPAADHYGHVDPAVAERVKLGLAAGRNGIPLIGDPDEIAAKIEAIQQAGISGLALGFVNYLDELPYFAEEVLPRLEHNGIRLASEKLLSA